MGNKPFLLKKCRDGISLIASILFSIIYIPHIVIFLFSANKCSIIEDVKKAMDKTSIHIPTILCLIFKLHTDRYFRTIYYHRIGPICSTLIGWYRPGDRYFIISKTTKVGSGMYCPHPYATIINANQVGSNFSCRHLTTIGNKSDDNANRPVIGDNVTLGANVTIIGNIHIGDNVTIGAGSVVVKNVPSNCIVVGNPAKVIKMLD